MFPFFPVSLCAVAADRLHQSDVQAARRPAGAAAKLPGRQVEEAGNAATPAEGKLTQIDEASSFFLLFVAGPALLTARCQRPLGLAE
eukprot:6164754-Pleurochrysis_carterae.AAC.1